MNETVLKSENKSTHLTRSNRQSFFTKGKEGKNKPTPFFKPKPVVQKMDKEEEENPVQTVQKKENNTGLPDKLKTGVENLSGLSMNDVKVHYNSAKPAQLNAHAYAQGTDIHVAPGQEKHLPHEAWHVVQQKQGRVQATRQMKGKVAINDDAGLEREADVMGGRALSQGAAVLQGRFFSGVATIDAITSTIQRNNVVQAVGYAAELKAVVEELRTSRIAIEWKGYHEGNLEGAAKQVFKTIKTLTKAESVISKAADAEAADAKAEFKKTVVYLGRIFNEVPTLRMFIQVMDASGAVSAYLQANAPAEEGFVERAKEILVRLEELVKELWEYVLARPAGDDAEGAAAADGEAGGEVDPSSLPNVEKLIKAPKDVLEAAQELAGWMQKPGPALSEVKSGVAGYQLLVEGKDVQLPLTLSIMGFIMTTAGGLEAVLNLITQYKEQGLAPELLAESSLKIFTGGAAIAKQAILWGAYGSKEVAGVLAGVGGIAVGTVVALKSTFQVIESSAAAVRLATVKVDTVPAKEAKTEAVKRSVETIAVSGTTAVGAGLGIAASGLFLASNPLGWALAGAAAAVGLGMLVAKGVNFLVKKGKINDIVAAINGVEDNATLDEINDQQAEIDKSLNAGLVGRVDLNEEQRKQMKTYFRIKQKTKKGPSEVFKAKEALQGLGVDPRGFFEIGRTTGDPNDKKKIASERKYRSTNQKKILVHAFETRPERIARKLFEAYKSNFVPGEDYKKQDNPSNEAIDAEKVVNKWWSSEENARTKLREFGGNFKKDGWKEFLPKLKSKL